MWNEAPCEGSSDLCYKTEDWLFIIKCCVNMNKIFTTKLEEMYVAGTYLHT
jgi:hypothetical protein